MISEDITQKKLNETQEELGKASEDLEKEREEKKRREEMHMQYLYDRDGNHQRYSEEEKKNQRRREKALLERKDRLEKELETLK